MKSHSLHRRHLLALGGTATLGALLGTAAPRSALAQDTGGDPLGSYQWPVIRQDFLGNQPFQFDPAIQVRGPQYCKFAIVSGQICNRFWARGIGKLLTLRLWLGRSVTVGWGWCRRQNGHLQPLKIGGNL